MGGTIFPATEFDDQKLIKEFSCVMAQIDGPVALMNDLFSFYKEYDRDEVNLVTNWCTVDGISINQALERLTDETIHACVQIIKVLEDKDPKVLATVRTFIHGYVTWHICELRYRLREVYESADHGPDEAKFRHYYEKALSVGWIDPMKWTFLSEDLPLNGCQVKKLKEVDAALINPFDVADTETQGPTSAHTIGIELVV